MKSKISEIDLHRSVADFLNWMVLPPAVWTTFPAGWTAMRKGAAGRLRGCGLKAGIPDILIFYSGRTIGIELKTTKGRATLKQENMFVELMEAGVHVYICRSIDDVHDVLLEWRVPMRKFTHGQSFEAPEGRRPQKPAQGPAGTAAQAEGT